MCINIVLGGLGGWGGITPAFWAPVFMANLFQNRNELTG